MTVIQAVTIAVAVLGAVVAVIAYLRGPAGLEQLGRQGQTWFDHAGDRVVEERPSEDERDAPLPRRRLRGRPE